MIIERFNGMGLEKFTLESVEQINSMQDYATQQMLLNNQAIQMHQQAVNAAMHANNMAIQMSTPGMGII